MSTTYWEESENRIFTLMSQAKSPKLYAFLRRNIHYPWDDINIFKQISREAAKFYQELCEKLTPAHCLKKGNVYRCGYCGEWLKKKFDKRQGKYVFEHPVREGWPDCFNYFINGKQLAGIRLYYKKYSIKNLHLTKIYLPHPMFYTYFGYPDKYEKDTKDALVKRGYVGFTRSRFFQLNGQHDVLDFALYSVMDKSIYVWDAKCWNGYWQKSEYLIQRLIEKFLAKRELIEYSDDGKALKQKWKFFLKKQNKKYEYTRYGLIFPTQLNRFVQSELKKHGIRFEVVYEKSICGRKI